METVKNHTNLSQSLRLQEILRLESADMAFMGGEDNVIMTPYLEVKKSLLATFAKEESFSPCWSLAALIKALPEIQGQKPIISLYDNYITYVNMSDVYTKEENLLDSCYKMILKLHALELL